MKLCFLGTSHAAQHLSAAAAAKGFELVEPEAASIVFVSEDTPTDHEGNRDMRSIHDLAMKAASVGVPVVVTSQCEPGFTRSLGISPVFHQAETLRIKDAAFRAAHPEMFIVGCEQPDALLPHVYHAYMFAFGCPILKMTLEEAEFAKIAINMTLAAQVDNTNRLAKAAAKKGVRWNVIADVLRRDSRVGPYAYLQSGNWRESPHLLRDEVTLLGME